ncbi:MAG: aminotransferase class V-fold PLP-dependent enzyme [Flavobacteriaceae bacterium]
MIKADYPILTNTTYLNTAYVGLMSRKLAAFRREQEEIYVIEGGDHYKIKAYKDLESMHQNFAHFFGLSAARCFGVSNFSSGLRTALSFLSKQNKVLLIEEDYPSLRAAFFEAGIEAVQLSMQPNIEEVIAQKLETERITILALSIIQYTTGLLISQEFLKQIKQEYPELIIIGDGTQFLGAHNFHFDESPFDLVVASGYKWLLAGFGNGLVLCSEFFVSKTHRTPQEIRAVFFQGHFDILAMASLDFAIKSLKENNFDALIQSKTALAEAASKQLTALEFIPLWVSEREKHSAIFNIKGGEKLFQFLWKKNIRTVQRGSGVRVSFHFYNTLHDLEYLIESLEEFKKLNSHLSFN